MENRFGEYGGVFIRGDGKIGHSVCLGTHTICITHGGSMGSIAQNPGGCQAFSTIIFIYFFTVCY